MTELAVASPLLSKMRTENTLALGAMPTMANLLSTAAMIPVTCERCPSRS
jgi:hypothetical protein